jgi:hypothetical protein
MKYKVNITEFERGWGHRPDGYQEFDDYETAYQYMEKVNKENSGTGRAPDIFWRASMPQPVKEK